MLIIEVKEDSIDRALKKYKRKYDQTKTLKNLRNRKHFIKPSIKRRQEVLKASYRLKKFGA